ncbi:MAG: pyridoxal phosphate-dependent aminotransferase [Gammaproteobacteria bacterium]
MKETCLAQRMDAIEPFHVMELLARARALEAQGHDVVHMEIGEPDFATAAPIVEAGRLALRDGRTKYTTAAGLPELREAIARYYADHYRVDVPVERILITPGASGALQLALGVVVNPGDEILMADPGYPCNRHMIRMFGGEAALVPVGANTAYQLTPDLAREQWSERTIGIMAASPSNPTGTVIPESGLRGLAELCRERGGVFIVDEIYHGLTYREPLTSATAIGEDIFVINSFSKYFGMTGWRLGWLIAPEPYVRALDKLAQNIFLAASTPAQYAALAAFEPGTLEILEDRRAVFGERRDFLLPALREIGFDVPVEPDGAFYIYAGSARFDDDSLAFATRVLDQAHVALTPGIDFGDHRAAQHVRLAYTNSLDKLRRGVDRIAAMAA